SENQMRLFRYLFSKGVNADVPDVIAREFREYFPDASDGMVKYLYVVDCLENDEDDIAALADAVMGQTMPTASGLEDAARKF
ncbi:MAG: hypothetical protein L0Z53_00700, partial [Acidobacteriales bacterium]|nr:hypothetical protein [Terriglobales bacterium]